MDNLKIFTNWPKIAFLCECHFLLSSFLWTQETKYRTGKIYTNSINMKSEYKSLKCLDQFISVLVLGAPKK